MDAGAFCSGHFVASTQEELLKQVADHLKKDHGVKDSTSTVMNYVAKLTKK